jgi:AcrR family transcriptional regulator
MRDISRACRKTVGGLYAHYRGKERIFVAVLEQYHPFVQVIPALQSASGSTVEERIRDGAHRMMAALGRQREALNLIFIEIVEFQGEHFAALLPRFYPMVQGAVARMREARGSMRDVPLEALSRSYFGLIFSFFLSSVALGNRMPGDDRALDTFIDIYLHGVLSRSAGGDRARRKGSA